MQREVVQLREQYDPKYQADKRALNNPAIVAPYPFIERRMGNVGADSTRRTGSWMARSWAHGV
jgi:hypothetical protein